MRTIGIAAAALVLAACAGQAGAQDGKLVISKAVAESFNSYKVALTSVGVGAYAVTEDGQGGAGAGCATAHCMDASRAKDAAVKRCEESSPGRKCIIFAEGREPVVDYRVGE